jgi:hypothetical protein
MAEALVADSQNNLIRVVGSGVYKVYIKMKNNLLACFAIAFVLVLTLSSVQATVWDGCISYYKLDESSGAVIDEVNNNNGTDEGATTGVTGVLNTAYSFDGNDGINLNTWLNITSYWNNNYSISVWANTSTLSSYGHIWYSGTTTVKLLRYDDYFRIEAWDGASNHAFRSATITTDTWYHVVVTRNTVDGMKMYVNAGTPTYNSTTDNAIANTQNTRLGRTDGGEYFTGTLDEVGFWNRELTAEEVTTLYNSGAGYAYGSGGADTSAPTYSSNSTNSTYAGTLIMHNLFWQDTALAGYIFSFNNGTGVYANDSWVSMTGTTNWSNVTKVSNYTVGSTIKWKIYANDTANNLNVSSEYSYTTTNPDTTYPIASQGTNPVDTYNATITSVKFDFKCSDNVAVSSIQLYGGWNGWGSKYSNSSYTNNTWINITLVGLPQGTYNWAVNCIDSASLTNITTNRTITIPYETSEGDLTTWMTYGRWMNHTGWDMSNFPVIAGLNQVHITGSTYAKPTVANGYIYYGDRGTFRQANASNISQLFHSYSASSYISASINVVGDYAYALSNDHILRQLNASDISQQFYTFNLGDGSDAGVTVWNGYVYATGTYNSIFYQLNASNISQEIARFTHPDSGGQDWTSSIANGYIYVLSYPYGVYQLNALNISQEVAYNPILKPATIGPVWNGYVYVAQGSDTEQNYYYQLNASNISIQIANFSVSPNDYSLDMFAIADGIAYATNHNGYTYALNASNISQNLSQHYNATSSASGYWSSPTVANGYVYTFSKDCYAHQLNASNLAQEISKYYLSRCGNLGGSGAYANGYIYFGSDSGGMMQLNASDLSLENYSPPPSDSSINVTLLSPDNATITNILNQDFTCNATSYYNLSSITLDIFNSTNDLIYKTTQPPNISLSNPTILFYQETANSTSYSGSWVSPTNVYDENWNTYGSTINVANIYFNYTKPASSLGAGWATKDISINNLSIPQSCWDYNPTTLILSGYSYFNYTLFPFPSSKSNVKWYCYNGAWLQLRTTSATNKLYEEGIYWYNDLGGTQITTNTFNVTLPYEDTFIWNCNATDIYSNYSIANEYYLLTFLTNISIEGENYNNRVLEYSQQTFNITIQKSEPSMNVTPSFYYDGTTYSTGITTSTSGDNITYSKVLDIPGVGAGNTMQSKDLYWNFTLSYGNTHYQNSTWDTQDVYKMFIMNNASSLFGDSPINTIKFTCIDDTTDEQINCTVNPTFKVWNPDTYPTGTYRSYTLSNSSNTSVKYYYKLPTDDILTPSNFTANISLTASATGYPSKTFIYNGISLGDTSQNKNLYLTSSSSGLYVSFMTITIGSSVISGVHVVVQRDISGVMTTIASGDTDSAGIVTFWLNPTLSHIITFSKSGYTSQTYTITPTQTFYTITMAGSGAGGTGYFNYTSPLEGISWNTFPPVGPTICLLDGLYNFTFEVTSRTSNIYNCTMNISLMNGTSIAYITGCNDSAPDPGTGGLIYTLINSSITTDRILGAYYITVNLTNGTIEVVKLEGTGARWKCVPTPGSGVYTGLKAALKDLVNLPDWGTNPQTTDFSKIVFFFLLMAILLACLNFFTGYDTAYPGAFIYIMLGLVVIFSLANGLAGPGFFYLSGAVKLNVFGVDASPVMDNWILAGHFFLLAIIYTFTTLKRYQA